MRAKRLKEGGGGGERRESGPIFHARPKRLLCGPEFCSLRTGTLAAQATDLAVTWKIDVNQNSFFQYP